MDVVKPLPLRLNHIYQSSLSQVPHTCTEIYNICMRHMTFTFQKQIQTNQSCFFVFVVERNHDLSVCGCCEVASTVYPSTLLWQIWLVDWVKDVCTVMDALHYLLIAVCGLTSCLLKDEIKLNRQGNCSLHHDSV